MLVDDVARWRGQLNASESGLIRWIACMFREIAGRVYIYKSYKFNDDFSSIEKKKDVVAIRGCNAYEKVHHSSSLRRIQE
jgi:hypothetical protein